MSEKLFKLTNTAEVIAFEKLLNDYTKMKTGLQISHISLSKAYEKLQRVEDGGRIFTSLLDIMINIALLKCEMVPAEKVCRKLCNKEKPEGILDSPETFFDLMDLHRINTAYIFRYRALWDKIIGFIILVRTPGKYEEFCKAKSKKRFFRKCLSEIKGFPTDVIDDIDKLITEFDNTYRTAEAHLTGKIRKYSFSIELFDKNTLFLILKFWNPLNEMLVKLGGIVNLMPEVYTKNN